MKDFIIFLVLCVLSLVMYFVKKSGEKSSGQAKGVVPPTSEH